MDVDIYPLVLVSSHSLFLAQHIGQNDQIFNPPIAQSLPLYHPSRFTHSSTMILSFRHRRFFKRRHLGQRVHRSLEQRKGEERAGAFAQAQVEIEEGQHAQVLEKGAVARFL